MTKAIICLVVGVGGMLIALLCPRFYALRGAYSSGREVPRWMGRLVFGFVGTLFVVFGIIQLMRGI